MNLLERTSTPEGAKAFLTERGMSVEDYKNLALIETHKKIAKRLHTSPNVITNINKSVNVDFGLRKQQTGHEKQKTKGQGRPKRKIDETGLKARVAVEEAYHKLVCPVCKREFDSNIGVKVHYRYVHIPNGNAKLKAALKAANARPEVKRKHQEARARLNADPEACRRRREKIRTYYANESIEHRETRIRKLSDSVKKSWSNMTDEEYAERCKQISLGHTDAGKIEMSRKMKARWAAMSDEERSEFFKTCGFIGEANSNRLARLALDELGIKYEQEVLAHKPHTYKNYRMDFLLTDMNIDLEIDGSMHDNADAIKRDAEKDEFMHSLGITVVRVRYDGKHVETEESMKAKISEALKEYNLS